MFVSPNSFSFIVLCWSTVFADLGLQGIDVNAEIFGYLGDGLIRFIANLTAEALNSAV
jgi:hypothetical protein